MSELLDVAQELTALTRMTAVAKRKRSHKDGAEYGPTSVSTFPGGRIRANSGEHAAQLVELINAGMERVVAPYRNRLRQTICRLAGGDPITVEVAKKIEGLARQLDASARSFAIIASEGGHITVQLVGADQLAIDDPADAAAYRDRMIELLREVAADRLAYLRQRLRELAGP